MPGKMTAKQEKHWGMAKEQAEKEGKKGDWAYVQGIFKRMNEHTGSKEPKGESKHDLKGERGESDAEKLREAAKYRLKHGKK